MFYYFTYTNIENGMVIIEKTMVKAEYVLKKTIVCAAGNNNILTNVYMTATMSYR